MKLQYSMLLLMVFALSACRQADNTQKPNIELPGLRLTIKSIHDTAELLNTFFAPIKIVNKTAIWKPGLEDYFSMVLSDDSLVHTVLDTIINIDNQRTIILFNSYGYNHNHKMTCHICSPVYSIATVKNDTGGDYQIESFKKCLISIGGFGHGYDTLSVQSFGKGHPILSVSSSYVGTVTVSETNTYFELDEYSKIFSFDPYLSKGDSSEYGSDYCETDFHLSHFEAKEPGDMDEIKLSGYRRAYDKVQKKIITKKQTEYYIANDFGVYERFIK